MFTRPPLGPLYAGVVIVLLTVALILGPLPAWWAVLLPPPAGQALQLSEAEYVTRYSGCADASFAEWQAIARSPHAARWFGALVREARPAAARLYGLAGLQATAPAAFDSVVRTLPAARWHDTVVVLDTEPVPVQRLQLQALLPELRSGALARIFADSTPRPEC